MTLSELARKARSTRRFREGRPVSRQTLERLVDLARLAACEGNRQALKYFLSHREDTNGRIFDLLGWAAYLPDWQGPGPGERPAAYIVVLGDREIAGAFGYDPGLAGQSILLGAAEAGLGGCIVGTVDRDRLRKRFGIPDRFEILFVIALGEPGERVEIETVGEDGDTRYRRDEEGVHRVPKRRLEDVIVRFPAAEP
ncbi:MAG: nitroreductase family protein [Deltaproteobacteria bacterium]|nr:nitroreductase family protein [Deltaproteobacteria bacterium]